MSGHESAKKRERESQRQLRKLRKQQRRAGDVTAALPAGTGWLGTGNGDLSWEPLRDRENHQGSRLRVRQSGR